MYSLEYMYIHIHDAALNILTDTDGYVRRCCNMIRRLCRQIRFILFFGAAI